MTSAASLTVLFSSTLCDCMRLYATLCNCSLPFMPLLLTESFLFPAGYCNQAVYACLTCTPASGAETAGFCYSCSITCHTDHDVKELWKKRNFKCDCGNHKFGGLFLLFLFIRSFFFFFSFFFNDHPDEHKLERSKAWLYAQNHDVHKLVRGQNDLSLKDASTNTTFVHLAILRALTHHVLKFEYLLCVCVCRVQVHPGAREGRECGVCVRPELSQSLLLLLE